MTVYTWKGEAGVDDQHQESHISYGLPPIEWFSRLYPDIRIGMKSKDIAYLVQIRLELLAALEGSLLADPVQGNLTEIVIEVLNTGCSLYRLDYSETGILVSQLSDVSIV